MSTYMAKKETVSRGWYVIDAAGKPLGKTAVAAANLLRGKTRPEFTPNVDCGEFVIVVNAEKAVLTGKKLEKKFYRHHSGYIGGLKEVSYKTLMATKPELAMTLAVKGMLPKNTLGATALTRLKVFRGAEHNHKKLNPECHYPRKLRATARNRAGLSRKEKCDPPGTVTSPASRSLRSISRASESGVAVSFSPQNSSVEA